MEERIVIVAAALAVLVLLSVVAARTFPKGAKVPMQWGITGKPTWYAPVPFAVSATPVLAAIVFTLSAALTGVTEKAQRDFDNAWPLMVGIFLFVHVVHLACAFWHFAARRRADG
ncbi:MAG: hypothetical protein ACKVRO_13000 [Micropepsaceae bacterium]